MEESNEDERTVWCGNLSDKVSEELLYELFLQAAPLERVSIPRNKDGRQNNYGFITFKHLVSVQYAIDLLNGTSLCDRALNIKPRGSNVSRQNSFSRDDVQTLPSPNLHIQNDMLNALYNINMLAEMGNQLLVTNGPQHNINSNRHNYNNHNTRPSPYQRWENSNYRDDYRESSSNYRRLNHRGYRGNRHDH